MIQINPAIQSLDAKTQYRAASRMLEAARQGETGEQDTWVSNSPDRVMITQAHPDNVTVQVHGKYQGGKLTQTSIYTWRVLGECWPTEVQTYPEASDRGIGNALW